MEYSLEPWPQKWAGIIRRIHRKLSAAREFGLLDEIWQAQKRFQSSVVTDPYRFGTPVPGKPGEWQMDCGAMIMYYEIDANRKTVKRVGFELDHRPEWRRILSKD